MTWTSITKCNSDARIRTVLTSEMSGLARLLAPSDWVLPHGDSSVLPYHMSAYMPKRLSSGSLSVRMAFNS